MHPLLKGRLRVALYLGAWVGIGALLAALLVLLRPRPSGQAMAFVGPLTLLSAFDCLSAWWVCRTHRIGSRPLLDLLGTLAGAALLGSAIWVAIGALWAVLLARIAHAPPDRAAIV